MKQRLGRFGLGAVLFFALSTISFAQEKKVEKKKDVSSKYVNLRANPLAYVLLGGIAVDLDIGILKFITIGPSYQAVSMEGLDTKVTAKAVGASVNLYFSGKRFTDSLMLSTFFYRMPIDLEWTETTTFADRTARTGTGNLTGNVYGGFLSYQWMWNIGFNITFGLGAAYYDYPGTINVRISDGSNRSIDNPVSGWFPAGQLTLGWAI